MKNKKMLTFLNNFEVYLGTVIFIAMTVLLMMQVISRYLFQFSFAWTEEICNILFIWMVYLGVSGAVLERKQIKIDAFIEALPFKWKKIMLIIGNIVTIVFCIWIIFPTMTLINNMAGSGATTMMLRISKPLTYAIIPLSMILVSIRYVQESFRLAKEDEEKLGYSKPTLDMSGPEEVEN